MKTKLFTGLFALALLGCEPATLQDYNARKYCQALNAANFEAFEILYSADRKEYLNPEMFKALRPTECHLEAFSMPYSIVRYTPRDEAEQTATLYLSPSTGKIKYDPIFIKHPAMELRGLVKQLEHEDVVYRRAAFNRLSAMNVPSFEYDPEPNPFTQIDRITKLRIWVEENEASFDIGEPKIQLSPLDLQRLRTEM